MKQEKGSTYGDPPYLRGAMVFETHAIDPNEMQEKTEFMVTSMSAVFVRGERNLFHLEQAGNPFGARGDRIINELATKYTGDYRRVLAHLAAYHELKNPSPRDLAADEKSLAGLIKTDRQIAYNVALMDALSRFYDYGVQVVSEKPGKPVIAPNFSLSRNLRDYRRLFMNYKQEAVDSRDITTALQIAEIARESAKNKTRTNLFLARGTLHFGLINRLPVELQPGFSVTKAEIRQTLSNKIMEALINGESISDELWEQGFQDATSPASNPPHNPTWRAD